MSAVLFFRQRLRISGTAFQNELTSRSLSSRISHSYHNHRKLFHSPRFFSSKNSGRDGSDSDSDSKSAAKRNKNLSEEDPFGVHYQDGESSTGNLGPRDSLPPTYIRDSTTRKFTGKVQEEISAEDSALLKLNPLDKEKLFSKRVDESLDFDVKGEELLSPRLMEIASRIREEEMALNTIGRKVSDVAAANSEAEKDSDDYDSRFSAPLSESEMQSLQKFVDNTTTEEEEVVVKGLMDEASDLIPNTARKSSGKGIYSSSARSENEEKNPDLDLEWMTSVAQRSVAGIDDQEDAFANLMPSDLNPARKVNRKKAKPIPRELLHHNNLSLLRRYMTPGGQVKNRVQTRLGAKEQRKISKLIKRARCLGLIPHVGQWKFEDHGNTKEHDIHEDRDWEKLLVERGLVQRRSSVEKK